MPSHVWLLRQLTMNYYQRLRGTKRMVDMFFEYSNLCTTVPPLEYGGSEDLLADFGSRVRGQKDGERHWSLSRHPLAGPCLCLQGMCTAWSCRGRLHVCLLRADGRMAIPPTDLPSRVDEQGIDSCEVDINGDLKDFGYTLEVEYVALTWMDLVNSFEFDWMLYMVLFTVVG